MSKNVFTGSPACSAITDMFQYASPAVGISVCISPPIGSPSISAETKSISLPENPISLISDLTIASVFSRGLVAYPDSIAAGLPIS